MSRVAETPKVAGGWRALVRGMPRGVDHEAVYNSVLEAGRATGGYATISALSAAIATLGLLLSSPAVVIGAMLVSPLMGPIILLGFAFWRVDPGATRRALASLALGLGVALAVAVVLTWLSPLKEPTAEILSRTRPNLFDLLVAAFSGIAGGYAVIRQRGETVIGVAIATALMPPIATVGFGLGIANWSIALGALLLFATNLIAIALAAAGMAAIYGFRPHLARRAWIGQAAVVLLVGALCIPLTLSLNTIALESRATVDARSAIRKAFGPRARLTSLSVRAEKSGLEVDALVATPRYIASASAAVARRLRAVIDSPTRVNLDQVVLGDPDRFAAERAAAAPPPDPAASAVQALRDAVPFPTQSLAYDSAAHQGVVLLGAKSGLNLMAAQKLEQGLRTRDGLGATLVVPPIQPLAPVEVAFPGKAAPRFGPTLAIDAWALQRWRAQQVVATVCGRLARRRREAVTTALETAIAPTAVQLRRGSRADCKGIGATTTILLAAPS